MRRSSDPQPPRHSRVIAAPGGMTAKHVRRHLAGLTAHANEVRDYGCHGTGFLSQGAMSPGGASGAVPSDIVSRRDGGQRQHRSDRILNSRLCLAHRRARWRPKKEDGAPEQKCRPAAGGDFS